MSNVAERIAKANKAAKLHEPFTSLEIESSVQSLQNFFDSELDWQEYRELLARSAHLTHKDWTKTENAAETLSHILARLKRPFFRRVFRRVLEDGHWDAAVKAAERRPLSEKPWVVLVTGVNAIRKTTAIYQPWFREILHQALIGEYHSSAPAKHELPFGGNSFFRQLDFVIATMANEEFRKLYKFGDDVDLYSAFKASIFARYRTVAEIAGILLVKEAKKKKLNVMVETSGRNAGMFHYVDHCFPDDEYRKLVVRFEVNDVRFAEKSVDARMKREMVAGRKALRSGGGVHSIIKANLGGPYGSKVLKGVQRQGDHVWKELVLGGQVGKSWYKAVIHIVGAEPPEPWVAIAPKSINRVKFAFSERRSKL